MIATSPLDQRTPAVLADRALIALRQWLALQGHHRLLLVCDPAAADPALDLVGAAGLAPVPFRLRHDDVSDDRRPYLVEIGSEEKHERLVAATVHLAVTEALAPAPGGQRIRSVCAWIHTDRSIEDTARELGSRAAPNIDGRRRLVRFWDPRVLAYRARNNKAQTAPKAQDGFTWCFIDWLGALCTWPGDDGASFGREALATLEPLGALNAVLQRVLHRNAVDNEVPWAQVEAALASARKQGVARQEDQVRLAADIVLHGQTVLYAKDMERLLTALRAGKGTYAGATAELEDEDWQRMAAEGARHTDAGAQGNSR